MVRKSCPNERHSIRNGKALTIQTWAFIGTGQISRSVIADLKTIPNVEVAAVYSRTNENARSFATEFDIAFWSDSVSAVLERPDVEVVYIATPFATHYELALQALNAGKHVLVEKPMTLSARDSESLFDLAQSLGLFVMEAMWFKFNPILSTLRQQIHSGAIGDPQNLRASFGMPLSLIGSGSRLDLKRSGGALLDQGIYPITLAHQIFGEPKQITVSGSIREDGLDYSEHFTLEYSDGRFAQCSSSMTSFSDLSASIGGPRGWMTLTAPFWATDGLDIHAGSTEQIFRKPLQFRIPREGFGYVPMLQAVVRDVEKGLVEDPTHGRADTVSVAKTMDSILSKLRS